MPTPYLNISEVNLVLKIGPDHLFNRLQRQMRPKLNGVGRAAQVMNDHPLEPCPKLKLLFQVLDAIVKLQGAAEAERRNHLNGLGPRSFKQRGRAVHGEGVVLREVCQLRVKGIAFVPLG